MVDQTENKSTLEQAKERNFEKVIVVGLNGNGSLEVLTDLDTSSQAIYTLNRTVFSLQMNEEHMISEAIRQQQEGVIEGEVVEESGDQQSE